VLTVLLCAGESLYLSLVLKLTCALHGFAFEGLYESDFNKTDLQSNSRRIW